MSYIETYEVPHSTVLRIYSEKDDILLDPEYQRNSDIWNIDKKMLLIDSILNEYDIPKLYFHIYSQEEKIEKKYSYSVIDGKQRLETIWSFIDNEFKLDDNFIYLKDTSINLKGMSYNDISKNHPKIKIKFDSFVLPIIGVKTDDLELIEEMFSRLNEASPLNAAEKRNAFGGDLASSIRKISKHNFFTNKVKISNKRFQHREIACRFILVSEKLFKNERIVDTKKAYLDDITKRYKKGKKKDVDLLTNNVHSVLEAMNKFFINNDPLLSVQGNMTVLFLFFYRLLKLNALNKINRKDLENFFEDVKKHRKIAEKDISKANFELLEFNSMTYQGTNDANSIKERANILLSYFNYERFSNI